jgi:hypothetical protein
LLLLQLLPLPLLQLATTTANATIATSDYGLDDRAIGVRCPAGAKDFSSNLRVQTCSGAHPASCTVGTGGPFPGGKALPECETDYLFCEVSSSHGGEYDVQSCLLGYTAV